MDLRETFSLSQHASGPTHLSGHTLDLIITRSSDDIFLASPKTTFSISDHFIIQFPIGFPRPALSCKKLTFRKLKNIDIAALSADIASSMLCASVHWDNIDALSDCFNKTLTDILDKFGPLKTRTMINRPKVPWFNDDIKQLKRQRRRLEKRAVKTDLPITEMVNLSLFSGHVPENWRTTVVFPLMKKPGLDLVYKNFRPVSNLPFISKVVEKAALQQLLVHCEKNAPLPKFQSGFHNYH